MPELHIHNPDREKLPFFTIGHSTRSIPEFVDLLRAAEVQLVVDVRSIRRSRTNPQYNEHTVGAELGTHQVRYLPVPQLGGRRKRDSAIHPGLNALWKNCSFHNYADYPLTNEFTDGFEQLMEIGAETRCAIMCAEAVWWRCHRRIIADYLLQRGKEVFV